MTARKRGNTPDQSYSNTVPAASRETGILVQHSRKKDQLPILDKKNREEFYVAVDVDVNLFEKLCVKGEKNGILLVLTSGSF